MHSRSQPIAVFPLPPRTQRCTIVAVTLELNNTTLLIMGSLKALIGCSPIGGHELAVVHAV